MKLSEMRQALAEGGIQLTKSLGQNFLHDANQLEKIVEAAEVGAEDRVLEIGPGLGPLTERLVERAGEVLAIEKDRRLFEFLEKRLTGVENLRLLHADALDFLAREKVDWSEWKMVSNLPYSVGSALLVELAQGARPPKLMVATVQLEVARRLAARAGEADYGLLALLVQIVYKPRGWFKIPAGCFFPEPEVDSACVMLVRREKPLLTLEQRNTFVRLVKCSFSQRRKMMLKLLKEEWPAEAVHEGFAQLGLEPKVRAEEVALEKFVGLTKILVEGTQR